jgi:tape measure domain-containing protein
LPPIKHTQIFDFERYEEALKEIKASTTDFGKAVDDVLKRLKDSQGNLTKELKDYKAVLQALNVSQQGASDTLKSYGKEVDELVEAQKNLKATQQAINQINDVSKASLNELVAGYRGLKAQYAALKPDQADFAVKEKEIKDKINEVVPAIKAQNDALKASKQVINAAEGSYKALQQQLGQLRTRLREMPGAFDASTGKINKNNKEAVALQKEISKLDGSLKNADKSMGMYFRNVGNYQSAFSGIGNSLASLAGSYLSVSAVIGGFNKTIDVATQFESLNTAIKVVTGTTEEYDSVQRFLQVTADKYGQDLITLTNTYKGLAAATKGTSVEGATTKKVFESVVQAGSALKLSNEQIEGSLLAIQQMFSKGTVQAEELRGQLGERLPGAFKIFAQALGVSEQQLGKMLQKGEILANDALPKFAAELSKVYGKSSIENANALVNETNRLSNAFNLFLVKLADTSGVTNFWAQAKRGLSTFFSDLTFAMNNPSWQTFFDFFRNAGDGKTKVTVAREQFEAVQTFKTDFEGKDPQARLDDLRKVNEERKKLQDADVSADSKYRAAKNAGLEEDAKRLKVIAENATKEFQVKNKLLVELADIDKRLSDQEKVNAGRVKTSGTGQTAEQEKAAAAAREKAQQEFEASIRKRQELAEKAGELELKQNELNLANETVTHAQFEEEKYRITVGYLNRVIEIENELGGKADQGRIDDYKKKIIDSEIDIAKELQKMREKGRVNDITPTARPNTAAPLEARDREFKDAIKQEEDYYKLISNGRDNNLKDEIEHLQRIKAIKLKYAQETGEEETKLKQIAADKQKEIDKQTVEVLTQAGQAALEGFQSFLSAQTENRISALEEQKQRELDAAGSNALAREKIEKDFNERIRKEKVKQAQQEKAFAAFQIAINIAQSIGRVLADVPKVDFGISTAALIAAYTALGAIQIAAVLSKPLPKFKTGTKRAPQGPAVVAEDGYELIESRGRFTVAEKPSIVHLKGGEKIYTHAESKKIIERSLKTHEIKEIAENSILQNTLSEKIKEGKRIEEISIMQAGLSKTDMAEVMNGAMKEITIERNSWDERGYRKKQERLNEIIQYNNARYSS